MTTPPPPAASAEPDPPELTLDTAAMADFLAAQCRDAVGRLGRRGAVVAISGGIDSSVTAALCVRGLGADRVFCLRLPERDGSDESADLGLELAEFLGVATAEESITASLTAHGCYEQMEAAVRKVFEDYESGWPYKLVRSAPGGITVFSLVVERPDGNQERRRMPPEAYRELLAAVNMKQRVRKLFEYTWADRLGYAVAGTPNLLEYDQGFFVKGGDGLADFKPIARLYKTQVYALARELGLPDPIATRAPTTDTFSLAQSQEEFYFGYPHEQMDLLMWGNREAVSPEALAPRVGMSPAEVQVAYDEIERRRVATEYLHSPALLPEPLG